MKNTYFDLIDQSYYFPQEGFDLKDGYLTFHGVSLKYLVEKYGTPFKLMYLPRIGEQIKRARNLFRRAIKKHKYKGKYFYAYCTKCCHFSHVVKSAVREGIQLETSSSFDIDLIYKLLEEGEIDKNIIIIHNGYKTEDYLQKIAKLNRDGFYNSILILDSKSELKRRNNLGFEYDYEYIINELVGNIASACREADIEEPDIFTEFGKYTVGESGATIFSVLEQKAQNDAETWYMVDNSLMNTIPDAWSINEKFIMLPINKWNNGYTKVNIGGISCDHSDYYNSEDMNQALVLPKYSDDDEEPLYVGFFHTGAYQDSISGYGGIKHCLIPSPKMIIVDRDETGNFVDYVYRNEQTVDEMLDILGY